MHHELHRDIVFAQRHLDGVDQEAPVISHDGHEREGQLPAFAFVIGFDDADLRRTGGALEREIVRPMEQARQRGRGLASQLLGDAARKELARERLEQLGAATPGMLPQILDQRAESTLGWLAMALGNGDDPLARYLPTSEPWLATCFSP
jgi:hypothetical protein